MSSNLFEQIVVLLCCKFAFWNRWLFETNEVCAHACEPLCPLWLISSHFLCLSSGENEFEEGIITSYSSPPELPDVMKGQEGSAAPSGLTAD